MMGECPAHKAYQPIQLFFLLRLARMLRQEAEYQAVLVSTDWRMKLIQLSITSSYQSCLRENVGQQARELLIQHRGGKR